MNRRISFLIPLILIAACSRVDDAATREQFQPYFASLFEPIPVSQSPTASAVVPFPFNGLFAGTTDGTLNIPNAANTSFVTAANLTDGYSTTASIFTDFVGFVDLQTASAPLATRGIIVITASGPATGLPLTPGVDYTLQVSTARDNVTGIPISDQRTRILIEPLRPLRPSTTYLVAVTDNLLDVNGTAVLVSDEFQVARSVTSVTTQAASGPTAVFLAQLTDTKKAQLEGLRSQLIRPGVAGFLALHNGNNAAFPTDLAESDLVLVWSFTTQSVNKTLQRVNDDATARTIFVANTTISTGDLGLGLADTADIYAGIFSLPYFLANSGGNPNSTAPLTTYWAPDTAAIDNVNPPALGGAVPCSALAPPLSTTICYPKPLLKTNETVPVLVTVPNGTAGNPAKPASGWPVVVFQHGITRNRTDMLALAPTLARAGFVTVSIDQPLHGITNNSANPATNPFYRNQLFTSSPAAGLITGERTFDLDLVDNTPDAANPCLAANNLLDGVIDSSGTHSVNLASLITSRDNLRQAESDIIHLVKSIVNLDLDNNPGALTATDIDETKIYFVGQSLGAIVGTAVLGVNSDILAASLNVPGGGIAKLLDASKSFGPRIKAGLGCLGVVEGTDNFETFLRFAQHLTDPGDPINFAVAANTNHPIHMIEVIGDLVVPNSAATATPGTATQDQTAIAAFLSGTDPLYTLMGLAVTGPITAGTGTAAPASADRVVQFAAGTAQHGSLLTPDADSVSGNGNDTGFLATTCEMQRQTASFLASHFLSSGTAVGIPIGGACP